jgi:hypothetical protein
MTFSKSLRCLEVDVGFLDMVNEEKRQALYQEDLISEEDQSSVCAATDIFSEVMEVDEYLGTWTQEDVDCEIISMSSDGMYQQRKKQVSCDDEELNNNKIDVSKMPFFNIKQSIDVRRLTTSEQMLQDLRIHKIMVAPSYTTRNYEASTTTTRVAQATVLYLPI